MSDKSDLKITSQGIDELVITRSFAAPLKVVFAAFTEPERIQKWLMGPQGWTLPVCEVDFRLDGRYRYVWRHASGQVVGVRGSYHKINSPHGFVNTEKFDEPWYPGEALITTYFENKGDRTLFTGTIKYESEEARDIVFLSPMKEGVAACYENLDKLLAEIS